MVLLDTSVVVPCLRRTTRAVYLDFLTKIAEEEAPAISMITWFEVIAGTAPEFLVVNRRFLDGFSLIDLGRQIADRAGALSYEWARKGQPLSPNDLLIGATALMCGRSLATTNRKHFPYLNEMESHVLEYKGSSGRRVKDTVHICA